MIEGILTALGPWRSPALAVVVALGAALLARLRPGLTGLAAALGLLAGLFDMFGVMVVTPRMLPERLPWLVLGATVAGLLVQPAHLGARGRATLLLCLILPATWWMLGTPRTEEDLTRVALIAPVVTAAFALALAQWRRETGTRPAWRAAIAALLMAGGLSVAGAPALFPGLAACIAAAALGTLLGAASRPGVRVGDAGTLPLAAALAGTGVAAALAWPEEMVVAAAAVPIVILAVPFPGSDKGNRT